jgi:hypothetical protein
MTRPLLFFLAIPFISCTPGRKNPVVDPHSDNYTQQIGLTDKKQKKQYQYSVYDKRTGSYRAVYLDKTGKYGVADSTGALVIPAKYDNMYTSEMGLFKCQFNGKWGFIDIHENPIIPFGKYDSFGSFSEGLAPALKNGKWGYINTYGQEVIPFRYYYVTEFHEGRAFAQRNQNGQSALIDREGNTLTDYVFSCPNMCFFRNNAAVVYYKNKCLDVIDTTGKPRFGFGYASLRFTDADGDYFWAQLFPSEVIGTTSTGKPLYKQGNWGLLDRNNVTVLPFEFEEAGFMKGGKAKVKKDGKWGIIKPDGEYLVPCAYPSPEDPHLNEALFAQPGEMLVDGSYQTGTLGKDGSKSVYVYDPATFSRYYGVLDKNNRVVLPLIYQEATCFANGYALVKKNNAFGYADSTGKLLSTPRYEYAEQFNEGLAIVYEKGSHKLINLQEQEVFSYPEIKRAAPYRYLIKVGGDAGVVNEKGAIVIPAIYYQIYVSGPQQNRFTVHKNYMKVSEDQHSIHYTVDTALFDLDGKQLTSWVKQNYSEPQERPLHNNGK